MIVNILRYNPEKFNWDREVKEVISRPAIVEPNKGEAIFSIAFYPSLQTIDVYMNQAIPSVVLCADRKEEE